MYNTYKDILNSSNSDLESFGYMDIGIMRKELFDVINKRSLPQKIPHIFSKHISHKKNRIHNSLRVKNK